MSTFPLSTFHKTPAVPESDFAGTIAGGALDGTSFVVGDEVFGFVGDNLEPNLALTVRFDRIIPADVVSKTGNGTLGEYTVVEPAQVVKKPKNISFEQAAAFPLAGLTAWHALVDVGGLKKGGEQKRVFINGGTGAVGIQGIQVGSFSSIRCTY